MKLPIVCSQCMIDDISKAQIIDLVEFRDDGRYEIVCPKGHKSVTLLQEQKFEILFEIGAHAIIDGYYREAVSSFTSSMERFYEFCTKVILIKQKVPDDVIINSWKKVSNQSERQLGAFIFTWTFATQQTPELLPEKQISFRNEVIHKGKIPTKTEAIEYGNGILKVIRPKLTFLKKHYADAIQKVIIQHLKDCRKAGNSSTPTATMCTITIVSLASGEDKHDQRSLEESLNSLKDLRSKIQQLRP